LFLLPLRSTSHLLRVLRYLRGTSTRRLFFPTSSSLQLQAYCDAIWATDPSDCRSLFAYYVFLGGSLIAWKTKKQISVSRLSAEAELRAMALVTTEVTWLRWLLEDFSVSISMPTLILSDSTGAISIAHDLVKHIGVDAHLHDHKFWMVLLLFSMCLQSSSWHISSRRLRLVLIISFTYPN
jgi:hypothetical protein